MLRAEIEARRDPRVDPRVAKTPKHLTEYIFLLRRPLLKLYFDWRSIHYAHFEPEKERGNILMNSNDNQE